ncbi:S-ribosylhomocysteine lyase [Paenibacillus sonchi]|uniref:S-ribosylhomocysteine lyase n=4 Tax=Paenibacillus TaxID=44249 RepID=A0A1G9LHU7_9BACL|nr:MULTISPECIES: S-ribosylhomocysteine lyase [Paenibacillus]KWX73301.1 S-ribosylhomocysteinase [Paenibacillus riograndensis]KWX74227.1 S-ribosylhomocysteinase [Paenibacillus jilunlii]MCE3199294.1 S-ribosylhomocysteine lyase [Paenibacillus sonchi]QQZ63729.1 S-ribosylhomocysteine lyase [Paenibacillus sonchi]CQR53691.1 S-ribosylhomocysteine lyase [Paenibacillus riograndensis SBR5]
MAKVESFQLDHTKVKAPYVRVAGTEKNEKGSTVQKYDLRLLQPNADALPTAAVHTLEHLLATYLRDELEGIIDISPMGCRTGFYLIIWDEHEPADVAAALTKVLHKVLETEHVPAVSALECGNYKDHSLFSAKEYARLVLEAGISDDPFRS